VEKAVENRMFWRFIGVLSPFVAIFKEAKPRKGVRKGLSGLSAAFGAINSPHLGGEGLPKARFP
jgi:hypothetical protein